VVASDACEHRYIGVADVATSHIVGLKGVQGIDKLDGNKPIVGADEVDLKEQLLNFKTEGNPPDMNNPSP
jgi:hypothetical protein